MPNMYIFQSFFLGEWGMETVFHLVDKTHVDLKMKIGHIIKTWRGSPFTGPSWSPGHLRPAEKSRDGSALAGGPRDPYLIIDWMHFQSIKPRVTWMLSLLSQTHTSELEVDPGHTTAPGFGPEGPDPCSRGAPATRCPPPASLSSVGVLFFVASLEPQVGQSRAPFSVCRVLRVTRAPF